MKVICLNVQGAKKHQIREEIKLLSRRSCPDILILLETMMNKINRESIIAKLGLDHFDYVLPDNHSGGIWVLWNNANISAQILLVYDKVIKKESIITGIYGPAQEIEKPHFWNRSKDLHAIFDLPWCIIGDFNEMECIYEKIGGHPLTLKKVRRMRDFLDTIHGESVPNSGR